MVGASSRLECRPNGGRPVCVTHFAGPTTRSFCSLAIMRRRGPSGGGGSTPMAGSKPNIRATTKEEKGNSVG